MTCTTASPTVSAASGGTDPTAVEERDAALRAQLIRAADVFGTPSYVVDVAALEAAAAAVEAAFPAPWVRQYSLKANDLPALMTVLAGRGWGANVVSGGEWFHALQAGVDHARITFEGIGKTDDELEAAVDSAAAGEPLRWLAVESADELDRLAELHTACREALDRDVDLPVLLRLNPDVQPETSPGLAVGLSTSKFGLSADDLTALAAGAHWGGGLRLAGVHVHMGSHLNDVGAWATAGRRGVELLAALASSYDGPGTPEVVDFGGGFPAFGADPSPAAFATALADELAAHGLALPPVPAIEPGRVLVGAAGYLVAGVLHSRTRSSGRQLVLDAGMTELIRPALYGSRHAVTALSERGLASSVLVEGAVCESTDTFGVHDLPDLRRGDRVVIHEAGAYAASFSSRYNGRPQPPEVLLLPDGTLELAERTPPPSRGRLIDPTPAPGAPERNQP